MNLRNEKVLQNCVIKKRIKNIRESKDIFEFFPTDHLIYEVLPTGENILNFYIHKKQKKTSKSIIINEISKEIIEIWATYVSQNNIKVEILSEKEIKTKIEKLVEKWQYMQKNVKRPNASKEKDFAESIKKILNIAKGKHKMVFDRIEQENEIEEDRMEVEEAGEAVEAMEYEEEEGKEQDENQKEDDEKMEDETENQEENRHPDQNHEEDAAEIEGESEEEETEEESEEETEEESDETDDDSDDDWRLEGSDYEEFNLEMFNQQCKLDFMSITFVNALCYVIIFRCPTYFDARSHARNGLCKVV